MVAHRASIAALAGEAMNAAVVTTTPSTSAQRFAGLEGLRTIGVVAVFVTHNAFATGTTFNPGNRVTLLGREIKWSLLLGHLEIGPAIFFMISAFLLYRPFAAALYAGHSVPSYSAFLRRRAVRVFPAYWIAIVVLYATNSIEIRNWLHALRVMTLTQIYTQEDFFANRTLVPTWTLATEITFYFFLIAYVACMRRGKALTPEQRLRRELVVVIALCVVAFAWRFVVYHVHSLPEVAEFWLPGTVDLFALGLGLAAVDGYARTGRSVARWDRWATPADMWALLAVVSFLAVPVLFDASAGIGVSRGWDAYGRNFFQMLCAFFLLVPVVFGDQSRGAYRRLVRLRPMAYVGTVSYGIYLWHDHWIVEAIHWSGGVEALRAHFWLVGISAAALSLVFGSMSYHWLERPALDVDARRDRRRREAQG